MTTATVSLQAAHDWLSRLLPEVDLDHVARIELSPQSLFHDDGPGVDVTLYLKDEAGNQVMGEPNEAGESAPATETKRFPLVALPTTY